MKFSGGLGWDVAEWKNWLDVGGNLDYFVYPESISRILHHYEIGHKMQLVLPPGKYV